jgi:hypothetical protein
VQSQPVGIDCGAVCSTAFAEGTSVTLTASPDPGSDFFGWKGDCSGKDACIVAVTGTRTVTARFTAICVVPRVVGLRSAAAKRAIVRARCRVGKVSRTYSRVAKDRVISQSRRPGVHVPAGTRVDLKLSRGRKKAARSA